MDRLKHSVRLAPTTPGVYLFKNDKNRIIYIGKAVNLRNRLTSYFSAPDAKTRMLLSRAVDFEVIPTSSDVEALTLEESLIKLNKPAYNVRLKDDKKFPYLKITITEEYPRIFTTRNLKLDGAALFGPYTSARSLRQTVNAVARIFGLRTCRLPLPKRACLKHAIKRCTGPCIEAVTREDYRKIVNEVVLFLNGKSERLQHELENRMWQAAGNENYEAARQFRDQLRAVRQIQQRQHVVTKDGVDRDVIGLARAGRTAAVAFFKIRDNKLLAREIYRLDAVPASPDSEIIAAFMRSTYLHQSYFPDEIVVPLNPDDAETLRNWFLTRGKQLDFAFGRYEDKRAIAQWAKRSAEVELGLTTGIAPLPRGLMELGAALKHAAPLHRIEAFDVSNIMGTAAVGASVSFKDGAADKSAYRRYKIKRVRGQNDFAMIREIVARRLAQLEEDHPDLLLIDGGKGQLNAALAGMAENKIRVLVLAFAKRSDQLFLPDRRVVMIPSASPALHLLKRIRSEAHRFAIAYHRKVRGRTIRSSLLDRIVGIGPRKKTDLLRYFGSIEMMRAASLEELSKVKGIQKVIAGRIYEALHA